MENTSFAPIAVVIGVGHRTTPLFLKSEEIPPDSQAEAELLRDDKSMLDGNGTQPKRTKRHEDEVDQPRLPTQAEAARKAKTRTRKRHMLP